MYVCNEYVYNYTHTHSFVINCVIKHYQLYPYLNSVTLTVKLFCKHTQLVSYCLYISV